MPTGYTAELCEKDVPFERFVMTCARAMGACVTMRESGLDVPIPRKLEPSDYHREHIEMAKTQLARLRSMTLNEAKAEAKKQYEIAMAEDERVIQERMKTRGRLLAMRAKVADWCPPTSEHEGLKEFMIQQLDETIRYDGAPWTPQAKLLSGEEWLENQLKSVERTLAYHADEYRKEVERTNERNQWIEDLRNSLGLAHQRRT